MLTNKNKIMDSLIDYFSSKAMPHKACKEFITNNHKQKGDSEMRKGLLTLALVLTAMLQTAWAYDFSATSPSGHTLYYEIISGTTNVGVVRPGTGENYNNYVSGNVVIPDTVAYNGTTYNVTELRPILDSSSYSYYGSFESCSGLISVTIPNSVTTIGTFAFAYCSGLTSVTIPNSVTTIGDYAFLNCRGLTSVTIPNSVTTIGNNAFGFVKNIIYNGTATGSPWGALSSQNNFVEDGFVYFDNTKTTLLAYIGSDTNVIIPNSVTAIESNTFIDCHNLTSVTIPYGVTSIRDYAFAYCYGLTSINIPSGVIAIESNAFRDCFNLTSVIIPNSVATIGDDAFSGCSKLTSVIIPNSVTSIGDYAFSGCSKLTSVSIPNSVTSIGDDAFYFVKHITYNGTATGSPWGALSHNGFVENGFVYNDSTKTTLQRYIGTDTNVIIPNGVTTIGECAFEYCSLTTVTIPSSVTSIGDYAFYFCSSLTSVSIPNSVTSIGEGTFSDCLSLISVTISNGVTSIGKRAFSNCYYLTSITIPNSVTSIGKGAFYNSTRLTSVIIPNSVTSIGERAFSWVKNIIYNGSAIGSPWGALSHNGFVENGFVYSDNTKTSLLAYIGSDTNITIPNSVTSIGDWTFAGCNYLTSVTIPNSVTIIGRGAFSYCRGLTSITIPNGVTSIGNSAFNRCKDLTSVTIPNSVTSIGDDAFEYCSSLTTLNFNAINCDNFSSGGYPFFNCPISTINIGDSVQQIPNNLIKHNTHLTTLTLGSNLTSIPANTFSACSSLQSVTCFSKTPPDIDSSVFPYPNTALLSVPHGSIESYSSPTSYWNMFFNGRISEN